MTGSGSATIVFSEELPLTPGSTCTLNLVDHYGDGCNGAYWRGFGQAHTCSGTGNTYSFTVPAAPPTQLH